MTRDVVRTTLTPDELARITQQQVLEIADLILTRKQLDAFRLHAGGCGYDRIALCLGISRDTARDRVQVSLTKIRRHIVTEVQ